MLTMLRRTCSALKPNGERCRANPLRESGYCLMHDPHHSEDVAESRKLGGLRKRREVAVIGAYDLEGMETVDDFRRILMIVAVDTLSLDNSIPRSRTLISLVLAAAKLLETGELEQRLATLEAAVKGQQVPAESVFDIEHDVPDFSNEEEADD